MNVLGALILRDVYTRFGRSNLSFAWLIFEPLLFAAPVTLAWSLIREPYEHGLTLIAMIWMGYLPLIMFRHISGRALGAIGANSALLYHRQVSVLSVYMSRSLVEIASNVLAFMFGYIFLTMIGYLEIPKNLPLFLFGYGLLAWFSVAVGMILCAAGEMSEIFEKVWAPISYLSAFVFAPFFCLVWLPEGFRHVLLWVPAVHAFEMIRGGYFGDSLKIFADSGYLAMWCAALTFVGMFLIHRVRRHLTVA